MIKRVLFLWGVSIILVLAIPASGLQEDNAPEKFVKRPKIYEAFLVQHDWVRYLEIGKPSQNIKSFLEYHEKFIPFQDIILTKFLPYTDGENSTYTNYFGVRGYYAHNFSGTGDFDFIFTTTEEPEGVKYFARYIKSSIFKNKMARHTLSRSNGDTLEFTSPISMKEFNAAFCLNTGDVDADGRADLIINGKLYLSSNFGKDKEQHFFNMNDGIKVGYQSVFLKNAQGPFSNQLIARVPLPEPGNTRIDTIELLGYNPVSKGLVNLYSVKVPMEIGYIDGNTPYMLYPMDDLDHDGSDELIVIHQDIISVLFSKSFYNFTKAKIIILPEPLKSFPNENLLVGGIGDYNQDGVPDFWISFRNFRGRGTARLIDGSTLIKDNGKNSVELSDVQLFQLDGYSALSMIDDGIGSSLSYHAGDIDHDGKPDFSIGAHYNLSYTGSLYVLTSANLQKILDKGIFRIDVLNDKVWRFRPSMTAEAAPGYFHFDNVDINGDGFDDIVISADNDSESGPQSGAVYVLDGRKITQKLQGEDGQVVQSAEGKNRYLNKKK